jgi:glycosyltransferase involved in cell wall biosynthesis
LIYVLGTVLGSSPPSVVHTVHSLAERERRRIGKWLPKRLFSRSVVPVAVGGEVGDSIRRVYDVDSVVIPNGIPLEPYHQARLQREETRRREGFTSDGVVFVSVGRLEPVKNPQLLIESFAVACGSMAKAQLILVGDGCLRNELSARVGALGLDDRVRFLGIRQDVPSILCASDVYAFSSDAEGSPLSIMEAMAAGLPILGTAVGDVPNMVPEGAGRLVSPRDGGALSQGMKALYDDAALRNKMGHAACQHAVEFDIEKTAHSYGALYSRLIENHSQSPAVDYFAAGIGAL